MLLGEFITCIRHTVKCKSIYVHVQYMYYVQLKLNLEPTYSENSLVQKS
jgi:hypothetical protein